MCRLIQEIGAIELDEIIFCNTGLESAETLEFVRAVDEQWLNGQLVMLEYCPREVASCEYRVVKHDELAREGEPFTALTEGKTLLPSWTQRICTEELKVRTIFRYLYDRYGHDIRVTSYLGIRADEPARLARMKAANEAFYFREAEGRRPLRWSAERLFPLAENNITRKGVLETINNQPLQGLSFDPADDSIQLSNCLGCFFSNFAEQVNAVHNYPTQAQWWLEAEEERAQKWPCTKARPSLSKREKWVREMLRREPTPDDLSGFAVNGLYKWKHVHEYAALSDEEKRRSAIPVVDLGDAYAGGCGDGHCGLDI